MGLTSPMPQDRVLSFRSHFINHPHRRLFSATDPKDNYPRRKRERENSWPYVMRAWGFVGIIQG